MRKIAFINEKGGTCKTTLAVNVAAYFANKGHKVLVVDLDTQGHAGKSLGLDVRALTPNVFHLLSDPSVRLDDVARTTAITGLSVVPAYKDMAELPTVLASDPRRAFRLADRLESEEAKAYDLVIFDSPPSFGLTALNILVAAEEVVIPVALTYLALDGCAEMAQTVRKVAAEYGRSRLRVTQVVPTLYRKTALAEEILAKLKEHFPKELCRSALGLSVKVDEAQSHGQTIWEYAPWSRGAVMLKEIAESIFTAGSNKRLQNVA